MSETNGKSGIFIGLNRGMVQTASKKLGWKTRPVLRKGKTSRRAHAVRELIREIAGLSPLEKRMTELIRTGVQQKETDAIAEDLNALYYSSAGQQCGCEGREEG